MITEEDFAVAAGVTDPRMAFVRLESRFRKVLHENLDDMQSSGAYDAYVIEYMNHTLAAARFFNLDFLDFWEVPSRRSNDISDKYHDFVVLVDAYKVNDVDTGLNYLMKNCDRRRHFLPRKPVQGFDQKI
jgi:hypothetical protein